MTIREFYTLVGGSYDDMSERFPSDALILRFLTTCARQTTSARNPRTSRRALLSIPIAACTLDMASRILPERTVPMPALPYSASVSSGGSSACKR